MLLYWPDSMPKANSTDSGYANCEFPFMLSNLSGVLLCNSFICPLWNCVWIESNGNCTWIEVIIVHGLDFIKDQTIERCNKAYSKCVYIREKHSLLYFFRIENIKSMREENENIDQIIKKEKTEIQ